MSQGSDHAPGASRRQLRVAIERDDVADVRQQSLVAGVDDRSVVTRWLAVQKPVQLLEFASLSLPADEATFRLRPFAIAMKEVEAAGSMSMGEIFDAFDGQPQQLCVALLVLLVGVGEVAEQAVH